MEVFIKIISNKPKIMNKMLYRRGQITIGDYKESFVMSLDCWSVEDYKRQWEEGLERIEKHNKSCLVASVQDPKLAPLINWWVLYKEGNKIFVQNELLVDEVYKEVIDNNPFTPQTCYNFIEPRTIVTEEGEKISEWSVDFKD